MYYIHKTHCIRMYVYTYVNIFRRQNNATKETLATLIKQGKSVTRKYEDNSISKKKNLWFSSMNTCNVYVLCTQAGERWFPMPVMCCAVKWATCKKCRLIGDPHRFFTFSSSFLLLVPPFSYVTRTSFSVSSRSSDSSNEDRENEKKRIIRSCVNPVVPKLFLVVCLKS